MVRFGRALREEYRRLWKQDPGFKWVMYGNLLLWTGVLVLFLGK